MGTAKDHSRKYNNKNRHKYRDDDGALVIPAGVVNEQAYRDYVDVHEAMMNDPNVEYQTSDPELIVNLLGNIKLTKKRINHLPTFERNKIIKIIDRLQRMKARCSSLKRKAFAADKDPTESRKHKEEGNITGTGILERRSIELIEMFGRMFSAPEVHRVVNMDWGYDISLTSVKAFRLKHIEKINERQEEFKRDFSDVRLGYKRSRLDELSWLYGDRKDLYRSNQNREDSKELRAILEQVRKEVEGDRLMIDGDINIKHEHRIQLQIMGELLNGISLKSIIIARVAAKLGKNPLVLQHRLMTSYYAKLTGFQPAEKSLETDRIIFPSQLIYDFDQLRSNNEIMEIEDAKIIDDSTPVIQAEKKASLEDVRMELMKRLMEQRNINKKTVEKMKDVDISGGSGKKR